MIETVTVEFSLSPFSLFQPSVWASMIHHLLGILGAPSLEILLNCEETLLYKANPFTIAQALLFKKNNWVKEAIHNICFEISSKKQMLFKAFVSDSTLWRQFCISEQGVPLQSAQCHNDLANANAFTITTVLAILPQLWPIHFCPNFTKMPYSASN